MTVLGNLAIDRIDGAPPSPGGRPSFVAPALAHAGGWPDRRARWPPLITRSSPRWFDGAAASRFDSRRRRGHQPRSALRYQGDARVMAVDAIGPRWDAAVVRAARITTGGRTSRPCCAPNSPQALLAQLAAAGTRIAFDGQGLVRVPELGPLTTDAAFDPHCSATSICSSSRRRGGRLTGGAPFGAAMPRGLGVPEIVVTAGSQGSTLYVGGEVIEVAPAVPRRRRPRHRCRRWLHRELRRGARPRGGPGERGAAREPVRRRAAARAPRAR